MRQRRLTVGNRQDASSAPSSPVTALPLTLAGFLAQMHRSTLEGTLFRSLRFPFCEAFFTQVFCPVNLSCLGFPRLPAPSLDVTWFSLPALYHASCLPVIAGLRYLHVQYPESHCFLQFVLFFVCFRWDHKSGPHSSIFVVVHVCHFPNSFWWRTFYNNFLMEGSWEMSF